MYSLRALEEAIVVLESHKDALSADVVDLALAALRNKLADLQMAPASQQLVQATILVADLSGFTAMSEFMDAEEVRDTINAVWQKLDNAITSWGGQVDKHVGDAIIALFGLPHAREDDAERAVQAALDMHMELAQINELTLQKITGSLRERHQLRMRIGVHSGPVLMGAVGASGEFTAVGDTVMIANQLEKLAPVGGVLISHELYEQVHNVFDVEPREPEILGEGQTPRSVYVVTREKTYLFRRKQPGGGYLDSRLVGRAVELEQLQNALRQTIEIESVQVVALVGACGMGKSRLLYEFERMLSLFPERLTLVKGAAVDQTGQPPYSLLLDMLLNLFNIQRRNSEMVIRNRLVENIAQRLPGQPEEVQTRARHIGELLGFDFSDWERSGTSDLSGDTAGRINVYADLVWLFTGGGKSAATILLLDNLQWADEGSLAWLDYLIQSWRDKPLLLVYAAQPSLFARRPSWQTSGSLENTIYQQINLKPLSSIDSRHLLGDIVPQIPGFPSRLSDQIVAGAGGNPLYLEEIVKVLQLAGVMENRDDHWVVHNEKLAAFEGPLTLANVLEYHLGQMSRLARDVLQKAAVLGHTFQPSGLLFLSKEDDQPMAERALDTILVWLEQQGWIYRRRDGRSAGTLFYSFPYDTVREVISQAIPSAQRQAYHVLAATWFVTNVSPQATQSAGTVAYHFEQADQIDEAVAWYGRAAEQAHNQNAPETAVVYYRRALRLLPDETSTISQRIQLHNGLGHTLCWLGRYGQAARAFKAARTLANSLSNAEMLVDALWGLFLTAYFQDEWEAALEYAEDAESLARDMRLERKRLQMQVARGMALLRAGELPTAVDLGKQAYAAGKTLSIRERAYSHVLLGQVGREMGHYQQAARAFEKAQGLFRQLKDFLWRDLLLAELGRLALDQHDWETAVNHYQTCLIYAQDQGHFYAAVISLRQLGHIALWQRRYGEAEASFRQALALAEKADCPVYHAYLAADMGLLYLSQAVAAPESALELVDKETHQETAFSWLEKALKLARQAQKPLVIATAVSGLAQLFLEDHLLDEAESQAVLAVNVAEKSLPKQPGRDVKRVTAVAWRVLGQVLAKVPQKEKTAAISGQQVSASACFGRSLQLLDELGEPALLEKAVTLRASALYELHRGHKSRAKSLRRQSIILFRRLGLDKEAWRTKELVVW